MSSWTVWQQRGPASLGFHTEQALKSNAGFKAGLCPSVGGFFIAVGQRASWCTWVTPKDENMAKVTSGKVKSEDEMTFKQGEVAHPISHLLWGLRQEDFELEANMNFKVRHLSLNKEIRLQMGLVIEHLPRARP